MSIVTKVGDGGRTHIKGCELSKDDPRVHAIGKVDSLRAQFDRCMYCDNAYVVAMLKHIDSRLHNLLGELALYPAKVITIDDCRFLDYQIECIIRDAKPDLTGFVRFNTPYSMDLNEARVRCREAERYIADLEVSKEMKIFINRLSDLLFIIAVINNTSDEHSNQQEALSQEHLTGNGHE
jgi:ATP:cob(I)alamin adenosyltransferase